MRYHGAEDSLASNHLPAEAAAISATAAVYPVNLLESELGEEVRELLSHHTLQLTSGHQAWLMMAILYLVERERLKAARKQTKVVEPGLRLVAEPD